ncbi:hypothetical protein [Natronorubrum aibiense]|uniref:Uncharacterized protein n=1 Tax=Natronorubrum aibiense TaxID=348826 RepID=A0A5P9P2J1_9EURY|nr:hypothetical protein [Natronorubrum aibiense]QFU82351.1 hypothetical protein GCU68_07350 [Natronorubrum aibiense]
MSLESIQESESLEAPPKPDEGTTVRLLSEHHSFVTLPPAPDEATVAVVWTDPGVQVVTAVANDGDALWPTVTQARGTRTETDDGPRREFRLDADVLADADVLDVTDETGTSRVRYLAVGYRRESVLERYKRRLRTWWDGTREHRASLSKPISWDRE